MKKQRPDEQFSITIFSRTDVRKKPVSFHITRRKLIMAGGGIVLAALIALGVAAASLWQVSGYSEQINSLANEAENNQNEMASLALSSSLTREAKNLPSTEPVKEPTEPSETPAPQLLPEYAEEITRSLVEMQEVQTATNAVDAVLIAPGNIAIGAAIEQIDTEFQTQIDGEIEKLKANAQYDEFQIAYTGDVEGDSDTVNNWADVLAVYAVATGTELRGLTSIPEGNVELLRGIYNGMNLLDVSPKKTTQKAPATSAEDQEAPPVTTLTACLSVESLTYEDGAELQGFNKEQKQALEALMSTEYYAVFAQLLGIDYYDGMDVDQLNSILANLEEGSTGAAIVQAALTRLGNPYSKGRRGSGRYVDCSYFTYWAYDQAGVVIPTSSVEQARYCYNNGSKVDMEDLEPGDLIFWSRKCSCGRWHEIHHAAIYLGDNKVIEASSRRGRVVINELWSGGEWRIFMCARPYA